MAPQGVQLQPQPRAKFKLKNLFFVREMGPLPKIVPNSDELFCFWRGLFWAFLVCWAHGDLQVHIQPQIRGDVLACGGLTIDLRSILNITLAKEEFKCYSPFFRDVLAMTASEILILFQENFEFAKFDLL